MKTINRKNILEAINKNRGIIFSVVFLKKDGSVRKMICRSGVKKYINGKGMSYDPSKRGLMVVFDMQKEQYRMINLKTITNINMRGIQYNVK